MKSTLLICFILTFQFLEAQIQTQWIDTTRHDSRDNAFFFTNRPMKVKSDGSVTFKNKSIKQTDQLYFCLFNYGLDTIAVKYSAINTSDRYPTEPVENNIFYKIYDDLRIKKDIVRFYIIVPGYSKTFKKQVYDFMYRLKREYADTLSEHAAIITFAWGNEWKPRRYYRAKRSAKHGARDFAIFQHMLEDFLGDTVFFKTHPDDIQVSLFCLSMGNQLLKKYLQEREEQGIPLIKTYEYTWFMGSDASWDSFEEGKGFHNINQLTDSVFVVINTEDTPLQASQIMNFRPRIGLSGPRNFEKLPGYITLFNITDILTIEDLPGLGHDYLLRNPVIKQSLIHYQFISLRENRKKQNE